MRIQSKAKKFDPDKGFEVAAAAFIILAPVLLSHFGTGWGLYAMFALLSLTLGIRLIRGGQIHIGVNAALGLLLGVYSLFAIAAAENMYRHIRLIFLIFSAVELMLLAADYFSMESGKGLENRLAYMVVTSGAVLALWNIIYWVFGMKFSVAEPFSAGMEQSDLLGIFMFAAVWCAVKTYSEEKRKKPTLLILCVPMVFALIMSRSLPAWFFGSAFAALYLFRKGKKLLSGIFAAAALGSGICLAVKMAKAQNAALLDAVTAAFKHPFGLGGGGFVSTQSSLQSVYYRVSSIGSGGELASSLGIIGLLGALGFIAWQIYLTVKNRSWFNAFAGLLCVYAFFAPMSQSEAGLLLFAGVCVYGEWRKGRIIRVKIGKGLTAAAIGIAAAAAVYGCVLATSEAFRSVGLKAAFTNEEKAAQRLSSAANINPFDGESCRDAAEIFRCLYEENGEKENAVKAEYEIKRAVSREENNALYYADYAKLLMDQEKYFDAELQCEKAVEKAPLNDDYKVMLSEILYKLAEGCEKGSVDAGRYYKRILECGEGVTDMEKKKIVNDYADKAQPYTRVDFYESEEEAASAENDTEGEE